MKHTDLTHNLLRELLVYKKLPSKGIRISKVRNSHLFKMEAGFVELNSSNKLKWVKYSEYIIDQYRLTNQPVFAIEVEEKFQDKNVTNILKGRDDILTKYKVRRMVAWEPSWEIQSILGSERGRGNEMAQV